MSRDDLTICIILAAIIGPVFAAVVTAIYYEIRFRVGLAWQRNLRKGME